MYKQGDKVVVICSVEDPSVDGGKYMEVSYDDTVICVNTSDVIPLSVDLELAFLEGQQKVLERRIIEITRSRGIATPATRYEI